VGLARRQLIFYGAAVALHAVAIAVLPRAHYEPIGKLPDKPVVIDIDELLKTSEATSTGSLTIAGTSTGTVSRAHAHADSRTVTGTSTGTGPEVARGTETSPAPTGSSQGPSLFITTPDAIGLSGPGSFRVDVAKQQGSENERIAENVNRAIMDPIHERERLNGSLTSGPVAQELERSTRGDPGSPFEGRAVFAIRVDEVGLVVSVGVAESSGDRRAWDDVAKRVLNALAQRRVHMPPGAKGVAMNIEITSKVTLPSGARVPLSIGSGAGSAVRDMTKGKFDRAPETPGIFGGSFDLSDIGAHPMRIVGARVLSENAF
jgi:hypothetical protein